MNETPPPGRGTRSASQLIRNAAALMTSSVGTALLGVLFWAYAARSTDPSRIGRASAELAAMVLLANLADVGVGSLLLRFLAGAGRRTRRFVSRCYAACTTFGLALAVAYVALGFPDRFLPGGLGWRVLFVGATVFWTIFVLQDSVLIGLRESRWVPVENILFAALKIVLLPVYLSVSAAQGIFLAWAAPVVLAVAAVSFYLFRKKIPAHERDSVEEPNFPTARELASFVVAQYANSLVGTIAGALMPLIVIYRLGATANGHFYLPWACVIAFSQLVWGLSTSFVVEAVFDVDQMRQHVDRMLRVVGFFLLPILVVGIVFAPLLLGIFGKSYAATGTTLLRLLLLATPGTMVTAFYTSFIWLERRAWWLAARQALNSLVLLGGSLLLLGHLGILGVGVASLATELLQAVIILPGALRRYRAVRAGRPSFQVIARRAEDT